MPRIPRHQSALGALRPATLHHVTSHAVVSSRRRRLSSPAGFFAFGIESRIASIPPSFSTIRAKLVEKSEFVVDCDRLAQGR